MKRIFHFFALIAATAMLASCSGHKLKTRVYCYADSTKYATCYVKVELPVNNEQMREELIERIDYQMSHMANFEGERDFDKFAGDANDTQTVVDYYGEQGLKTFSDMSQNNAEERAEYADKDIAEDVVPVQLECHFELNKTYETSRLAVFTSWNYVYLGGAHGGVVGDGDMTFDKASGEMFTNFLLPSSEADLQPAIREKLMDYFSENGDPVSEDNLMEYLLINGDIIPLPVSSPAPGKEGLTFTYMQYEIASYASGMPSFTIPYDEIKPYLTEEAIELLGL